MSKGRKAFGPSKKKACDLHHCKKPKRKFRIKCRLTLNKKLSTSG